MERKLEIHKDETLKDAVAIAHKVRGKIYWSVLFNFSVDIKGGFTLLSSILF